MKRTIRYGTFESNSSSMHSMVIMKETGSYTPEEIMDGIWLWDGKLSFDGFGDLEFGRAPFCILCTFYDKLRYAIASFCGGFTSEEEAEKEIKKIEDIVYKYVPEFKGFKFNDHSICKYGDIDHQSAYLLQSFLAKKKITLEEFLTHREYMVVIDGDEYYTFDEYIAHHIIDVSNIDERFR